MKGNSKSKTKDRSSSKTQSPKNPDMSPLASIRGVTNRLSSTGRGFLLLTVLLLAAFPSLLALFPRNVTPASAPPDLFSGERAMKHLPIISREPHPAGSPNQVLVRE